MSDSPFDISKVMQQAQQLQERIRRAQEDLRHREVEATVGGGMVTARANGRMELVELRIDPQELAGTTIERRRVLLHVVEHHQVEVLPREPFEERLGGPIVAGLDRQHMGDVAQDEVVRLLAPAMQMEGCSLRQLASQVVPALAMPIPAKSS